jgi:hypothetical protein
MRLAYSAKMSINNLVLRVIRISELRCLNIHVVNALLRLIQYSKPNSPARLTNNALYVLDSGLLEEIILLIVIIEHLVILHIVNID